MSNQNDATTEDFMSYDKRLSHLRAELAARDAEIERLKAELAAVPTQAFAFYWDVTEYGQEIVDYAVGDLGDMERAISAYLASQGHDPQKKFEYAATIAGTLDDINAVHAENERLRAELAAVPKAEFWWYWNVTDFSQATVNYNAHSITEKTRAIERWFAAMDYTDDEDD